MHRLTGVGRIPIDLVVLALPNEQLEQSMHEAIDEPRPDR